VTVRKKAFVYLIRNSEAGPQLLVFESLDEPGFEVVKGQSKPGETLEQTARRELEEEAGIADVLFLSRLGTTLWNGELQGFCLMKAPPGIPARFQHTGTGDGIDCGVTYSFRWLPIDDTLRALLVQGCDAFIDELIARAAVALGRE